MAFPSGIAPVCDGYSGIGTKCERSSKFRLWDIPIVRQCLEERKGFSLSSCTKSHASFACRGKGTAVRADFLVRMIPVRHRSRATYSRQPRQVRKEATVTGSCVCSEPPVPDLFVFPHIPVQVRQIAHHRAQYEVYLRVKGIRVCCKTPSRYLWG